MKYRVVVSGFGDEIAAAVVPGLLVEPWIEHIHWIAESAGRTMPGEGHEKLTIIDQHRALYPPYAAATPASDLLVEETAAAVMPMMDRLEKHGPPISDTRRRALLGRNARYWVEYVERHRINGYIGANTPHEITDYLIAEHLKDRDGAVVRYFLQWRTDLLLPVSNYRDLGTDRAGRISEATERERTQLEAVAQSIIGIYRKWESAATEPFYMRRESIDWTERVAAKRKRRRLLGKLRRVSSLADLGRGLRYLLFQLVEKRYLIPHKDGRIRRQYAAIAISDPDLTVPYFYFPLHLQPENTTSPLGGSYVEQRLLVAQLLEQLPPEVYIYVKENPKQGYQGRGKDYYAGFPGDERVKFISLDYSSITLIENALGVATITGTAALEAMWVPRPVLVFGYTYTGSGPGVYRVHDASAIRDAVAAIINEEWEQSMKPETFVRQLAYRSLCTNVSDYHHRNGIVQLSTEVTAARIVAELRAGFI